MVETSSLADFTAIRQALARTRTMFFWIVIITTVALPVTVWLITNSKIDMTTRLLFGVIGIAELLGGLQAIVMIWRYRNLEKVPLWVRLKSEPQALLWVYEALRTSWFGYKNARIEFCFVDGKRLSLTANPNRVEVLFTTIRQIAPTILIGLTAENRARYTAQIGTEKRK